MFRELRERVISRGLCTGCGTCAGVCPEGAIAMATEADEPAPLLQGECPDCGHCLAVCAGECVPMAQIERSVFGRPRKPDEWDLGVVRDCYAGWACDPQVRRSGSSGGVGTALACFLLESGQVDGVILAGFDEAAPWRAAPVLATTMSQVRQGTGSKYAMVPVNALLREAARRGLKRLAAIGLPCHVHGLRKLQMAGEPADVAALPVVVIGLFCAAEFYFEGTRHLLCEWAGVPGLAEVARMEYRGGGWPGHLVVDLRDGRRVIVDRHRYMYHHLMLAWKRDRCAMCLDWSAELADLSLGDYWQAGGEGGGVSAVVLRSDRGAELWAKACQAGAVSGHPIDPFSLLGSPGYELKKHGAAFTYAWRVRYGWPVPDYGVEPRWNPVPRELHFAPESGEFVRRGDRRADRRESDQRSCSAPHPPGCGSATR